MSKYIHLFLEVDPFLSGLIPSVCSQLLFSCSSKLLVITSMKAISKTEGEEGEGRICQLALGLAVAFCNSVK